MFPETQCTCDPTNQTVQNLEICQRCRDQRDQYLEMGFVEPDYIDKNVWIGGLASATDEVALKARNINRILILLPGCCLKLFPNSFIYKQVPLEDSPDANILPYLDEICRFLADAHQDGVLVHCTGGSQRSGAAVTAFLMKSYGISVENALNIVRTRRDCVYLSENLKEQLRAFVGRRESVQKVRLRIGDEQAEQGKMRIETVNVWKTHVNKNE